MFERLFGKKKSRRVRAIYELEEGILLYDVIGDLPDGKEIEFFRAKVKESVGLLTSKDVPSLVKVVGGMLEDETGIIADESRIVPVHYSARVSLDAVISQLRPDGPTRIAASIPNWPFWESLAGVENKHITFKYFRAFSLDQFVENYRKTASKKRLDAMLLVNPSNPLGIKFDEQAIREIDRISELYGVRVVVDDLLRSTLPTDERVSPARFLSRPFVIEGLSHRFGEAPLGHVSYILLPDDSNVYIPPWDDCSCSLGVENALKYSQDKIAKNMEKANMAFDAGLSGARPDLRIQRASPYSITGILALPEGVDAFKFCMYARQHGVMTSPVSVYYPKGHRVDKQARNLLRIGTGAMPVEYLEDTGRKLGKLVRFKE